MTEQQQKIENSIKGKQTFALNISDSMRATIIQNSREQIASLEGSLEKLMPAYTERKAFLDEALAHFNEIKVQVDNFNESIKNQKIVLDSFHHYSKQASDSKVIQFTKEKKTVVKSQAGKRQKIDWLAEFETVLQEENKFMSFDDVFNIVITKDHILEVCKTMVTYSKNPRYAISPTKAAIFEHAIATAEKKNKGWKFKPVITVYKERLGLASWVDQLNVPQPKFMKEFMYGQTA
jgi:hypothetical protein